MSLLVKPVANCCPHAEAFKLQSESNCRDDAMNLEAPMTVIRAHTVSIGVVVTYLIYFHKAARGEKQTCAHIHGIKFGLEEFPRLSFETRLDLGCSAGNIESIQRLDKGWTSEVRFPVGKKCFSLPPLCPVGTADSHHRCKTAGL
jgi:hypothetical protein